MRTDRIRKVAQNLKPLGIMVNYSYVDRNMTGPDGYVVVLHHEGENFVGFNTEGYDEALVDALEILSIKEKVVDHGRDV